MPYHLQYAINIKHVAQIIVDHRGEMTMRGGLLRRLAILDERSANTGKIHPLDVMDQRLLVNSGFTVLPVRLRASSIP